MDAFRLAQSWPVPTVAGAVLGKDGTVLGTFGPVERAFPLASVTKPLAAYAVLVAVEEEALGLDDPAGPPGSTVRHLLAHASGLAYERDRLGAAAGTRRIYSNVGFDLLGEAVQAATGMAFPAYLHDAVCAPLGLTATRLVGSPAYGGTSTVADLAGFARELMAPTLLHPTTLEQATSVQFPGLDGVVPGFGRQTPNDWGLGFELKGAKRPHWTATTGSPRTFGHFGRSGTFLWVDPDAGAACVCLTDREFEAWAVEAWPVFNDAVLAELRAR